jgi:ubiquinone/menaquinone biosynthesis C-methylase UbiE
MERIRKDFDRIALLSEQQNDPGGIYDRFLLGFLPAPCSRALEIGCGTGSFTRLLATKANEVAAIDLSAEMIRLARLRSITHSNISYQVGDIIQMKLPQSHFDCIVMISTLHHLPLEVMLTKAKEALAADGVLIIHDLLATSGVLSRTADMLRLPISIALRWKRTGRLLERREERRAWAEHGKGEVYLSMKEVRAMRDRYLVDGEMKEHLLWRYSVVWRRRVAASSLPLGQPQQ